jgi:hypothetical protein
VALSDVPQWAHVVFSFLKFFLSADWTGPFILGWNRHTSRLTQTTNDVEFYTN